MKDLSFEALVEETNASIPAERGKVNKALLLIRQAMPEVIDDELAMEIRYRAGLYRARFSEVALTPTALAAHWERVVTETEIAGRAERRGGMNLVAPASECSTCGGDRFVVVSLRPVVQSQWMKEHGIESAADARIEEMAACPSCNAEANTSFQRQDGTWARQHDPAKIREMMGR
jgi:predicted Zn-ribbon and HTH transcriptional regulator